MITTPPSSGFLPYKPETGRKQDTLQLGNEGGLRAGLFAQVWAGLGKAEGQGAMPGSSTEGLQEQGEGFIPEPGLGAVGGHSPNKTCGFWKRHNQPTPTWPGAPGGVTDRPHYLLPLISCPCLVSPWINPTRGRSAWEPTTPSTQGQPPGLSALGEERVNLEGQRDEIQSMRSHLIGATGVN